MTYFPRRRVYSYRKLKGPPEAPRGEVSFDGKKNQPIVNQPPRVIVTILAAATVHVAPETFESMLQDGTEVFSIEAVSRARAIVKKPQARAGNPN